MWSQPCYWLSRDTVKCLICSDHVFQALRAGGVCTDAYSCQACHPDVTLLGKAVMNDQRLGKSGVALSVCGVQLANVCVRACLGVQSLGKGL